MGSGGRGRSKENKKGYLKKGNGGEGRRKRKKINMRIDGLEG